MKKQGCSLKTLSHIGKALFSLALLICSFCSYSEVSIEELSSLSNLVSIDKAISDDKKEQYLQQLDLLKLKANELTKLNFSENEFRELSKSLENETGRLKTEYESSLKNLPKKAFAPSPKDSIKSLDQKLTNFMAKKNIVESELELLQQQIKQELGRPEQLKVILQRLVANNVTSDSQTPPNLHDIQSKISYWQKSLNSDITIAKRKSAEAELISSPLKLEWLKSKLDLQQLEFDNLNSSIKSLEVVLADLMSKEAESLREKSIEAEENVSSQHPILKRAASENTALSNLIHDMTEKLSVVKELTTNLSVNNQSMGEDYNATQHKIEVAGLSHALGQVLLEEKRRLSSIDFTVWEKFVKEDEIAEIGISQIQHEENLRKLRDKSNYIDNLTTALNDSEKKEINDHLAELVNSRIALLNKLVGLEKNYLRSLGDLDYVARQFKQQVLKYENLISEKLLWIKSSPGLSYKLIGPTIEQINDFWTVKNFLRAFEDIKLTASSQVPSIFLSCILLVIFLIKRSYLINLLLHSSDPLKRLTTDSYKYTLKALSYSVILASPCSILLLGIGYSLCQEEVGRLTTAIGEASIITGGALYFILLVRELCREKGLLLAHFKWSDRNVSKINNLMKKLCYIFCPALFISVMVVNYDFGSNHGALQHLSFIVSMVILSCCIGTTGIFKRPITIQKAVSFSLVLSPMILAGFATLGYVYTASTLCHRLIDTFSYFVTLLLVHQLTMRWLVLAHRKLAYKTALERRAAAKLKAQDDSMGEAVEEPGIDLDAVSKGGKELLNTALVIGGAIGLWLIWAEVIPAFYVFDQSALWHHPEVKDGLEVQIPVTLFDLGLALFISVITILAAKRLPTLLEFILLPYFKLSAGSLYTVRTLTGYLIIAIGIIWTLNTVGASWSQLQWMAAALSVGIGFGLQEIVANFISGLIILFERPIRVGDVVTVGGTDGVVTRIQIRATTIRNWDSKELLVPNKEFITNQLLNWTLSDQTTRLVISVGVAYGSDISKAMDIVLDAAKAHPNVISEPEPNVVFASMGDNALNLILRSYVAKTDHRAITSSELNIAIYNALNEAGMSIPFPQRDIHLNTSTPLEIRLQHGGCKNA